MLWNSQSSWMVWGNEAQQTTAHSLYYNLSHYIRLPSWVVLNCQGVIDSPDRCKLWGIILLLQAEELYTAKIHPILVHGRSFMSDRALRKWFKKLQDRRFDVHTEGGNGHTSLSKKKTSLNEFFSWLDFSVSSWLDHSSRQLGVYQKWDVGQISFNFKIHPPQYC